MTIPILTTSRTQDAVYWAPVTDAQGRVVPGLEGQPTYRSPVPLKVLWADTTETVDAGGGQKQSKARVLVGEDLLVEGVMFKGTISQVPAGLITSPHDVYGASVIFRFDKVPTPDGTEFVRVAWL